MGKRGRKNKKRNAFLEVLEQKKPTFDPKIHKSFEKYYEEYYNLDFEDIVGGVKCRFKYHKTVPNDFGLTTDEVCINIFLVPFFVTSPDVNGVFMFLLFGRY